jgi:hypothetical protein
VTEAEAALERMDAIRAALPTLSAGRRCRLIAKLVELVADVGDADERFDFLAFVLVQHSAVGHA